MHSAMINVQTVNMLSRVEQSCVCVCAFVWVNMYGCRLSTVEMAFCKIFRCCCIAFRQSWWNFNFFSCFILCECKNYAAFYFIKSNLSRSENPSHFSSPKLIHLLFIFSAFFCLPHTFWVACACADCTRCEARIEFNLL